jgi:hypothetical protein
MNSEERPFSMHYMEERMCEFCGDVFYAHHGLQRYCPIKFGRKDYCKQEQKKLVSEKKLADKVTELSKTGMIVYPDSQINKNIEILKTIMGNCIVRHVTCIELDQLGFEISVYESRISSFGSHKCQIKIGDFILEWINQENNVLTFKISRR